MYSEGGGTSDVRDVGTSCTRLHPSHLRRHQCRQWASWFFSANITRVIE